LLSGKKGREVTFPPVQITFFTSLGNSFPRRPSMNFLVEEVLLMIVEWCRKEDDGSLRKKWVEQNVK
jgi:hypothetical protein